MTTLMDQATQLRQLAAARAAPAAAPREAAAVIAITSGKGGVGKSSVAVNLAAQMARAGRRVALIDADLGLANADMLCGIDLPYNLSHVVSGQREIREVTVRAPGGFLLVGGASGLTRMTELDERERRRLLESLGELERDTDVLLIDTGAGIHENVLGFARAADDVLVVTTPEPTAMADAYAVIKVLSRNGSQAARRRLSLLVNQCRAPGEARGVYERLARVARQFIGVSVLDAGGLPWDEHVATAVRRRAPFVLAHPRCPASTAIAQVATRLQHGMSATLPPEGFFERVGRWLRRPAPGGV